MDLSLEEKFEKVSEDLEGTLGVAIKNLGTGKEYILNADESFYFASVYKLPVLVELYRQVEGEMIELDEKLLMTRYAWRGGSGVLKELSPGLEMTIRDYRTLMMLISDNISAQICAGLVRNENTNNTMKELGLDNTVVGSSWIPNKEGNVTTPRDIMLLLEKIYEGEAASRESCDEIIELMKKCQTGKNRISKYLPRDDVEVAHKTGTISGVVDDVGIVFPKAFEPFIICVFTKFIKGWEEGYASWEKGGGVEQGEEAIAKISKAAYDHFKKQD